MAEASVQSVSLLIRNKHKLKWNSQQEQFGVQNEESTKCISESKKGTFGVWPNSLKGQINFLKPDVTVVSEKRDLHG